MGAFFGQRKRLSLTLAAIVAAFTGGACLGESYDNIYDPASPGGLTNNLILLTALGVGTGGTNNTLIEGNTSAASTHEISLTEVPIAPVTITLSSPDGQILINGETTATLVFTESNYNFAQSATITAADDSVAEGNHTGSLTHSVQSLDPAYSGSTFSDRSFDITDNDATTLSESGSTSVTEGGATSVYTVSLSSEPTADVQVTITSDSETFIDTNGNTTKVLNFTTSNWNTGQSFTIIAVDDAAVQADPHTSTLTVTYSSTAGGYASAGNTTISISVSENDFPG